MRHETHGFEARRARRCAHVMLGCLVAFFLFFFAACLLYPGGNWLDRAAPGHRFWRNFFCDVTQPVSLSGVANPYGSRLAQLSLFIFAGALGGLFFVLPRRFSARSRCRPWVRRFGALSLVSFVLVPLTPSEHFGRLHAIIALASGALGACASACAIVGLFGSDRRARWLGVLGTLAVLSGLLDGALFAYHLNDAAPPPVLVPALQKVAAALLSSWIAAVALVELRVGRAARVRLT